MSVAGKGGAGLRQVWIKKTNASELLRTCRKTSTDVETGIEILSRKQVERDLSTAPLASGMKAA